MEIFNKFILVLVGLAFVVTAVSFALLITRNMRQGRVFRRQLAEKVDSLNMGRMLRALGIDLSAYLHKVPVAQVGDSAKNCDTCDSTEQCDEALNQHAKLEPDDIDFCPNQQCLSTFKELEGQPLKR